MKKRVKELFIFWLWRFGGFAITIIIIFLLIFLFDKIFRIWAEGLLPIFFSTLFINDLIILRYKGVYFKNQYLREKEEEEKRSISKGYFDRTPGMMYHFSVCCERLVAIGLLVFGVFLLFKHGFAPLS